MSKAVTFAELEGQTFPIVLASDANVEHAHRQLIARFRPGYYTQYCLFVNGVEVLATDNWREALIEFNHGNVLATMGETHAATK